MLLLKRIACVLWRGISVKITSMLHITFSTMRWWYFTIIMHEVATEHEHMYGIKKYHYITVKYQYLMVEDVMCD